MSAPASAQPQAEQTTGCYVYAIVPGDVELTSEARGLGDPPSEVRIVRADDVAALVSDIDVDRPLGRPEDLIAHEQLLDSTVTAAPVLPVRFGAVVTSRDAVVEELLKPHHDQLIAALREMEGRAEYVVKARYVEQALLAEVLDENPAAAELRERTQGRPEEATRDLRLQLGELISAAVEAKREADTNAVIEALGPVSVASGVRPPTHEQDAAHVAFLADLAREDELVEALNRLARDWKGRITVRLLGPLAPYDFVVTPDEGVQAG